MKAPKPFCQNCANNQGPILEQLREIFAPASAVLEIGSGTGQHAVFFGARMPHLTWYTSDLPLNHAGIQRWLDEARVDNVRAPLDLDVEADRWPALEVDAVYSANTAHIMTWAQVTALFRGAGALLPRGGRCVIYGPFNYNGAYTSAGNARFDRALRDADPASGIRDFEAVDALAAASGFALAGDHSMPANNRLLIWRRS